MKYLNKNELAREFGVSVPTISNWCTHPEFPIHKSGDLGVGYKFILKDVKKWLDNHEDTRGRPKKQDGYTVARERKMLAEACLAEIKLKEIEGELVHIDDIENVVSQEYSIVRTHLRALPSMLPPLLVNKSKDEMISILTKKIDGILNELSDPTAISEIKEEQTDIPETAE